MKENLFDIKNILKLQRETNFEIDLNKKMIEEIEKDWLKNMPKDNIINLLYSIKDELKNRGIKVNVEFENTKKQFVVIDYEKNNILFSSVVLDKNETLDSYILDILCIRNYCYMEINDDTTIFDLDNVLERGIKNEQS